jgi:membrane protease YdiL (CAAX protease family)
LARPSVTASTSSSGRLWPLLLTVNAGWLAFIAAALTILPDSIAASDRWPRAMIRMAILLVPAVAWLARFGHGPWPDRLGLTQNCCRGLMDGVVVSLLWLVPKLIMVRGTGRSFAAAEIPPAVWLNAVLGSPFAEELLYRQIVFRTLSERFAVWKAVVVSALWFTLLHVPVGFVTHTPLELPIYLVTICGYGVVFAVLYAFTRSLWAPLIPHAVNNLYYAAVGGA